MKCFAFVFGGRRMLHDTSVAKIEATRASDAHAGLRAVVAFNGCVSGGFSRAQATANIRNRHSAALPLPDTSQTERA